MENIINIINGMVAEGGWASIIGMAINPVFSIIKIVTWILLIIHKKEKSTSPIINLSILTNGYDEKTIITPNLSLAEDYSVENEEILYGLFTNDN